MTEDLQRRGLSATAQEAQLRTVSTQAERLQRAADDTTKYSKNTKKSKNDGLDAVI